MFCNLPAVSIKAISNLLSSANFAVLYPTDAGSVPKSDLTNSAPIFFDQNSSCSIAAALKVSAAPKTIFFPLFLNNFPNLPIVVVFPTPFTPAITIIDGEVLLRSSNFLSYG